MKTSKIEKIDSVKEWAGQNGTVYYHLLEMENGDKINLGKKKHLAIGEELTYEVTDSGQEYNKAKTVMPMQQGFNGSKFKGVDQDAILYQVCLKEAANIVGFDGWNGNEQPADKCKYLTDMAYQLSVLSKSNIEKLKNK
jgi:hypothetical protein